MNKTKTLLIVLVVTLISITLAGTYAYFTATVTKTNEVNKETTIRAKELSNLTLTGETVLNNNNMIPGETSTKNISITNTNEFDFCTAIEIYNVTNTFVNQNDVTVALFDNTTKIDEVVFPSTGSTATIENLTIPANTTKNYRVVLTYKNTDVDQSQDMGKTLTGTIRAVASNNCRATVYYEFGEPTTSSTTDYTTLGKTVFGALEGEKKSICIIRNGKLHCINTANNCDKAEQQFTEEKMEYLKQIFGEAYCGYTTDSYNCESGGIYCSIQCNAVYCEDNQTNDNCNLNYDEVSCDNE
jgi:predicted ribosomally synthesized peptide with SipW-like signal peptide